HQEDFCQAIGLPPTSKYEVDRGPSLKRIANILEAFANPESVEDLLRATTLNLLIGNGDAHAKNFSLIHDKSGSLRLAPLYDLLSTSIYGDEKLAMSVDNVQRFDRVTFGRLINEAASWGMPRPRAENIVRGLLGTVPDALAKASAETPG